MTLENLVRIRQLNLEPPDKREFENLVRAAIDRLNDSENEALTYASRFDLAYRASSNILHRNLDNPVGQQLNPLTAVNDNPIITLHISHE